jgi:hypothetical protein
MRRLAAVLAFVGFTLGLVALPATASAQTTAPTTSQGGGPNPLVSGPFTGTSTFDFGTPPSSSSATLEAHQVFDGTYTVPGGRTGSFHLDGCASGVGTTGPFPYSGTFTLTAPNGATMNGTDAGTIGNGLPGFTAPLSITLRPTRGTQQFTNVGGVVILTGTWVSGGFPTVPGPINGSLAGALTH